MKKKTTKKKERPFGVESLGEKNMSAKEIKKYQKLIEQIGSRNKGGFFFVSTSNKTDKGFAVDGCAFMNKTPRNVVVKAVLQGIQFHPIEAMALLADELK